MFDAPRRRALLAAALTSLALWGCTTAPQLPVAASKPKLLVFLVVDGLPQRQILAYRDQLAPDGLARFLERGAWFPNAHYAHSFTVTGAGHAIMLSGANPSRTGVIGNDWLDPLTGQPEYCAGDTSARYIGHATNALDGTSPKNLKVETLGDVLRRLDPRSKVIGISGKDRGAILPAGKSGVAYMYMGASGEFASSTHYMAAHPAWVNAFNAAKPADRYFKQSWTALLPEADYARSLPDQQKWFGPGGGGLPATFGAAEDKAPGPRYYTSLLRGPFVDQLSLDFARAAIAGEALGQDDAPDILAVSLSGHDYVNHAFSAESRLSHDHLLQLDRMLQAFFRELDATVGAGNYLATLTADHGFMPAPEVTAAQGQDAGRINLSQALGRINQGLTTRFGPGKWVLNVSGSTLLLDTDAVADAARTLLLAEPGFASAYTRRELLANSQAGVPLFEQMRKSWHPDVSGEVQFALKPNWMFASATSVTTHGSPYAYDTNVPMLVYGPKWVKPGRIDARVEVVDMAPTLARLLQVPAPASSEGRQLPLLAP